MALRYAFSKRNGQRTSSVMIVLGIMVSVVAILIIGSVVDALQSRQIDTLRAVESFDLILETSLNLDEILQIEGVSEAWNFAETTAIVKSEEAGTFNAIRIRALDLKSYSSSQRLNSDFLYFPVKDESGITLPYYGMADINNNDSLKITFLKKGKTATIAPYNSELSINGIYWCSEQTFSNTTAFIDLDTYTSIFGTSGIKIGVFLTDKTQTVTKKIQKSDPNAKIVCWQEYNKAIYSALLLEKIVIYVFMGFMFLILCTNLKNSTKRLISNRKREGAVLRAIGMTKKDVTSIFLTQGIILSILGLILGNSLGYVSVSNIYRFSGVFARLSGTVGSILDSVNYSPITALVISLSVLFLSFVFVRKGCRSLYKKEIMEVLLYESY